MTAFSTSKTTPIVCFTLFMKSASSNDASIASEHRRNHLNLIAVISELCESLQNPHAIVLRLTLFILYKSKLFRLNNIYIYNFFLFFCHKNSFESQSCTCYTKKRKARTKNKKKELKIRRIF
jgi:hypothetical protein